MQLHKDGFNLLIIVEYFKITSKFGNLYKMDNFLEKYNYQREVENLNRLISTE